MNRLQEYFENTGVMKQFFAKKLGTTPTTLCAWLSGRSKPRVDMAIKIEKQTDGFVTVRHWLNDAPNTK